MTYVMAFFCCAFSALQSAICLLSGLYDLFTDGYKKCGLLNNNREIGHFFISVCQKQIKMAQTCAGIAAENRQKCAENVKILQLYFTNITKLTLKNILCGVKLQIIQNNSIIAAGRMKTTAYGRHCVKHSPGVRQRK